MQVRVQKIDSNGVVLPLQVAEALKLVEGSEVVIQVAHAEERSVRGIRFATLEEAMQAYRDTEPEYREVYRALAK